MENILSYNLNNRLIVANNIMDKILSSDKGE
jgi:hypothetical protein